MVKIAVCEDKEADFNLLNGYLKRYQDEQNIPLLVTWFKNAESLLFDYKKEYDLIFMDILRPGRNGRECARRLREKDPDTLLIFTTTVARRATRGYEVEALDYILKPVEYPSFAIKFTRARRKIKDKKKSKSVLLKVEDGIRTLSVNDITYIEVTNHTLTYHTKDGKYETYGSLKKAREEIDEKNFYKINSCYIVNRDYITKREGHGVYLSDTVLKLSHPKKAEFTKAYFDYVQDNRR